jgi:Crp-like helix-turn-helix domain
MARIIGVESDIEMLSSLAAGKGSQCSTWSVSCGTIASPADHRRRNSGISRCRLRRSRNREIDYEREQTVELRSVGDREGSHDRHSQRGRFLRGGLPYRANPPPVHRNRNDRLQRDENWQEVHDGSASPGARVFRYVRGIFVARNIRYEEDLVDQLFNSSEKRLARVLLLLAHFGKEGKPETVIPKISQETLAEMVGTTRSRVSFFMNRFRKLGFIDYDGGSGLQVHSSLLDIVLHD